MNVERGPLVFAWALLTRPGGVAREYVEGRRRRYYGPFATLAVLVGLAALALQLSGFQALSQEVSSAPATVLQLHFNLVLLVQLPLLGVTCALLFHDAHLTLPEHMLCGPQREDAGNALAQARDRIQVSIAIDAGIKEHRSAMVPD